ncbi:M48 family metalloprotease [Actinomadura rupiterrae]|uniref:M48 family metalloprotease n=1 Tax=Actinomadura rupiterrae TaxID=559627 RepID=UPI0020A367C9|nr:M48 family metalloprotease [Actinomadura rupiterrae]MCP2337442.1 beta-lactamase regulating signal transducer with metallopeptidase domain [Actinomadura rupiterrae]
MSISVYLPWLCSLLLAWAGPFVARWMAPARAAWSLALAAAACAAAALWGLVLMTATLLGEAAGPVTDRAVREDMRLAEPIPELVSLTAATLLGLACARAVAVVRRHRAVRARTARLCADHPHDGELVVVTSPRAEAFAVPGRPGRIVVTTTMLVALDAEERRVLLAHERAHLRLHHELFQAVLALAAAVDPLLIPTRRTVAFLLERWADEEAALEVGSRPAAARSLARAALATASAARTALAYTRLDVLGRVRALQSPPSAAGRTLAATTIALCLAVCLVVAASITDATADFITLAHRVLPH